MVHQELLLSLYYPHLYAPLKAVHSGLLPLYISTFYLVTSITLSRTLMKSNMLKLGVTSEHRLVRLIVNADFNGD